MSVLYIVFPLALLIATAFVIAFAWASRRGQFDDLDTPPLRVLHDDDPLPPPSAATAAPPDKNA